MKVRFFGWIAMWLLLATAVRAQTPVDATDRDLIPTLFAEAGADGSLDVAWRSTDGRLMLSTFSGQNFGTGRQIQLNTNLNLLGGLARDEAGNRYIAAFRRELANEQEWGAGFRPGVAHILKVAAGSDQTTVLADVNTAQFITNQRPIINPLAMNGNGAINSELVYANGTLTLGFGHNNGQANDIHNTGALIGIGTDGSVKYNGGGEQHTGHIRLGVDGTNFVKAQTFDQGLGLSTLKRSGDKYVWSNFVLLHELDQSKEHLYIGGIVPTADNFLLIFSTGPGYLWYGQNFEHGTGGGSAIKMRKVARNFDALPKFDWWNNVRTAQGNFPLTTIAAPPAGKSFLRPIVTPLPGGSSIVAYEQWGDANGAEGVRATLLDANGNVQRQSDLFAGVKIQKSTRGIYLPTIGRMGWVNGDSQGNKLVLHTLDAGLNLASVELGRGGNTPTPPPVPVPVPPAPNNNFAATDLAGEWAWPNNGSTFTLRAANNSLTWVDQTGEYALTKDPNLANTYKFSGGASLTFSSKDAAAFIVQGNPNVDLRRRTAAPLPNPPARLTAAAIPGRYVRDNPDNDYHEGRIEMVGNDETKFRWTNKANVTWLLTLDAGKLEFSTGPDNPYFNSDPNTHRIVKLTQRKNPDGTLRAEVEGFTFGGEFYRRAN